MNISPEHPFLETINNLRSSEEIVLYTRLMDISPDEASLVTDFLELEYKNESLNYPYAPPDFNPDAGLWAAQTVYYASQLLLYRDNKVNEIELLLSDYKGSINPSAILSADLCLRFLPQILQQAKILDPEDPVIALLEKQINIWHYSGIATITECEGLNFEGIKSDDCLKQLYTDRVIAYKAKQLAQVDFINTQIKASLGNWKDVFWKEYKDA